MIEQNSISQRRHPITYKASLENFPLPCSGMPHSANVKYIVWGQFQSKIAQNSLVYGNVVALEVGNSHVL